jgi:membrane-associated phospholipid phosphatase
MSEIVNTIGKYGPHLMGIMTIIKLWTNKRLLYYALIGVCMSMIINQTLKYIFQYPRPKSSNTNNVGYFESYKSDPFGFPSGHSQNAGYLTMMMYYTDGSSPLTFFYAIYTVFIMWQRVNDNKHFTYQVIAGVITGAIVAVGVYYSYKKHLLG